MFGFRRDCTLVSLLLVILIAFAVSSSDMWINWAVFAFIIVFWLIVDFMFFDTDNFVFDPSSHDQWAARMEQIRNA